VPELVRQADRVLPFDRHVVGERAERAAELPLDVPDDEDDDRRARADQPPRVPLEALHVRVELEPAARHPEILPPGRGVALERNAEKIEARLLAIIKHGNDADALRAIHEWTNRVYGRPTERVEQVMPESETERQLREMSKEERTAKLLELERRSKLRLVDTGTES
jgi:hypothetical protein